MSVDRRTTAKDRQGVEEGDDTPVSTDSAEDAILRCIFNLTILRMQTVFLEHQLIVLNIIGDITQLSFITLGNEVVQDSKQL